MNNPKFQIFVKKLSKFHVEFDKTIKHILGLLIALLIVMILGQFIITIGSMLFEYSFDHINNLLYTQAFSVIVTLFIAMEFKTSIVSAIELDNQFMQAESIVLIALLALSRKMIIMDSNNMSTPSVAAIAFSILALGCVYWIIAKRKQ